jgi:hypothetical protein
VGRNNGRIAVRRPCLSTADAPTQSSAAETAGGLLQFYPCIRPIGLYSEASMSKKSKSFPCKAAVKGGR